MICLLESSIIAYYGEAQISLQNGFITSDTNGRDW